MTTYNHMFSVAFTVAGSDDKTGETVTITALRSALLRRIIDLDTHQEWTEAVGVPLDTYEEE